MISAVICVLLRLVWHLHNLPCVSVLFWLISIARYVFKYPSICFWATKYDVYCEWVARMSVVSPTSRFAYKSIRLHWGRFAYTTKSFRLHGQSRFAYIKVVSPTFTSRNILWRCTDEHHCLQLAEESYNFDRDITAFDEEGNDFWFDLSGGSRIPTVFNDHHWFGIKSVRSKVVSIESSFDRNQTSIQSKQRFQ